MAGAKAWKVHDPYGWNAQVWPPRGEAGHKRLVRSSSLRTSSHSADSLCLACDSHRHFPVSGLEQHLPLLGAGKPCPSTDSQVPVFSPLQSQELRVKASPRASPGPTPKGTSVLVLGSRKWPGPPPPSTLSSFLPVPSWGSCLGNHLQELGLTTHQTRGLGTPKGTARGKRSCLIFVYLKFGARVSFFSSPQILFQ